jgi:alcohol dehydrogenase class IV
MYIKLLSIFNQKKGLFQIKVIKIISPYVMKYNSKATGEKYIEIAIVIGACGVDNMSQGS